MFTSAAFMQETKRIQAEGSAEDTATMISPGVLVTAPGGHGTEYGVPIPTIKDPAEAQCFVDARVVEGSDFIKIIVDDGGTYGLSRPKFGSDASLK